MGGQRVDFLQQLRQAAGRALHQRLAAYYYLMGNVQESLVEFEKGLTLDSESAEEFFEFCADAVNDPLYIEILAKFLPTKE